MQLSWRTGSIRIGAVMGPLGMVVSFFQMKGCAKI